MLVEHVSVGGQGTAAPGGLPGCAPGAGGAGRSAQRVPALHRAASRTEARCGCCGRRAGAIRAERAPLERRGWLFAKEQEQRLVQQIFQGSSALGFLTTCENPVCIKGSESLQKMCESQKLVTHKNRHG